MTAAKKKTKIKCASAFQEKEKDSFVIIVGGFFLKILCIWCVLAQIRRLFGNFLCVLGIATVVTFLGTKLNKKGHELASGAAG